MTQRESAPPPPPVEVSKQPNAAAHRKQSGSGARVWMLAAAAVVVVGGAAVAVFWNDIFGGGDARIADDGSNSSKTGAEQPKTSAKLESPISNPAEKTPGGEGSSTTNNPSKGSQAEPPVATKTGNEENLDVQVEPLGEAALLPLAPLPHADVENLHGHFRGLDIEQGLSASTFRANDVDYLLRLPAGQGQAPDAKLEEQISAQVVIAKVNAHNRFMQMATSGDSETASRVAVEMGRLERLSEDPAAIRRVVEHLQQVVELDLKKDQEYDIAGMILDGGEANQKWLIVTSIGGKSICTLEDAAKQRVENPEYLRWAPYAAGSSITHRFESGDNGGQTYVSEHTYSVVDVQPTHLVLKSVIVNLPRLPDAKDYVVDDRVPRFVVASQESPPEEVDSGEEQLSTLKLFWKKTRKAWKDAEGRDLEALETNWTSDWVPGKTVRSHYQRDYFDPAANEIRRSESRSELIAVTGPETERIARAWEAHRLDQAAAQVAELETAVKSGDKLAALQALNAVAERAGRGSSVSAMVKRVDAIPWPEKLTFELGAGPNEKLVLMRIPAGSFQMGSSRGETNEAPVHKVTFTQGFYMSETEVTEAQWKAVTGAFQRHESSPRKFKTELHPADGMSSGPVHDFLKATGEKAGFPGRFRIPTEAEWEYACRAGSTSEYHFGDDPAQLGEYAWFKDNAGDDLHPVAQKKPNAWGLYDMHGNALEWCCDDWQESYQATDVVDPAPHPSDQYRSEMVPVRSGAWNDEVKACRSASRRTLSSGVYIHDPPVGIRIVFQP